MRLVEDQSTTAKSTQLKGSLDGMNLQYREIRRDLAHHITQLDLAVAKGLVRLFNCEHEHNRDSPDGNNSTCEVTAAGVVEQLFAEYAADEKFVKEYLNFRRTIIAHHRAHEKHSEGRGMASYHLRRTVFAVLQEPLKVRRCKDFVPPACAT